MEGRGGEGGEGRGGEGRGGEGRGGEGRGEMEGREGKEGNCETCMCTVDIAKSYPKPCNSEADGRIAS